MPAEVWQHLWNIGCQHAGSGDGALGCLSRSLFKTATVNRPVPLPPSGTLLWTCRRSKTRKVTTLELKPMEFMRRFLQHILPRGFARVRTFGWLHPAAKVRLNRVRALLRQPPRLTDKEKTAWNPPELSPSTPVADPSSTPGAAPADLPTASSAPCCPRCQRSMLRIGAWKAGEPAPFPKRPKHPHMISATEPAPMRFPVQGEPPRQPVDFVPGTDWKVFRGAIASEGAFDCGPGQSIRHRLRRRGGWKPWGKRSEGLWRENTFLKGHCVAETPLNLRRGWSA